MQDEYGASVRRALDELPHKMERALVAALRTVRISRGE